MIRLMLTLTLSIVLVGNIAADKFYFIVMGDNRGAKALEQPEVFKQIIREVNLLNPDLVIIGGDLIYGYTSDTGLIKREWQNFKHIVSELDAPYYLVVGNHDVWDEVSQQIYLEECGPLYYSFDYKGCHFIVLDTEIPGQVNYITGEQLQWLKGDLEHHKDATHIFVFMHRPVWAYEGTPGKVWMHDIHPLLVKYGVDIVFSGHWHVYEIDYRDGIRYVITGGAGAPIGEYPQVGDFHHYLLCTVDGESVEIAVIKPGNIFDETIVKFEAASRFHRIRTQCISYPYIDLPLETEHELMLMLDNPFTDTISGTIRWQLEGFEGWQVAPIEQTFKLLPATQQAFSFKVSTASPQVWYPTPIVEVLYPYAKDKAPIPIKREIRLIPSYDCERFSSPPIIDGKLEDWQAIHPIVLDKRYQVASRDPIKWIGPSDKSGKIYFGWDDTCLYFGAEVTDDIFCQPEHGVTLSHGDCIILAFDVGDDPRGVGKLDKFLTTYFFTMTEDGPTIYRRYATDRSKVCDLTEIAFTAKRVHTMEIYEAKLPWAALKEGFTPAAGDIINLDIVLTDNDGEGREDWLQWTPGYMEKGEPSYYGKLILR